MVKVIIKIAGKKMLFNKRKVSFGGFSPLDMRLNHIKMMIKITGEKKKRVISTEMGTTCFYMKHSYS